jgi:hypothetical protein
VQIYTTSKMQELQVMNLCTKIDYKLKTSQTT